MNASSCDSMPAGANWIAAPPGSFAPGAGGATGAGASMAIGGGAGVAVLRETKYHPSSPTASRPTSQTKVLSGELVDTAPALRVEAIVAAAGLRSPSKYAIGAGTAAISALRSLSSELPVPPVTIHLCARDCRAC